MKKIVAVIACLLVCVTISAQQPAKKIRYQGDVQLGYSVGVGEWAMDRVNFHLINSARFNDYVSLGFGLGADIYVQAKNEFLDVFVAIPVFVDIKGYLPVSSHIDLFASFDVGTAFAISGNKLGLKLAPSVGVIFKSKKEPNTAFTISIGYDNQKVAYSYIDTMNAISLKLGFSL